MRPIDQRRIHSARPISHDTTTSIRHQNTRTSLVPLVLGLGASEWKSSMTGENILQLLAHLARVASNDLVQDPECCVLRTR